MIQDRGEPESDWSPPLKPVALVDLLDHGTDHRSQVCTALTSLGVEPPKVDVFSFGLEAGRITEKYPDA